MKAIGRTIEIFEYLRKKKFVISIEDGTQIYLSFFPEHYHHLVGYQHLTDLSDICNPQNKQKFYNDVKKHRISNEYVESSVKYSEIEERVESFDSILDILSPGEGKIIVEFDKTKLNSSIIAKFYLYKRVGNSLLGEPVFYNILFLGYNETKRAYYPATYIVEHSTRYIVNQKLLDCTITVLDK